MKKLIGWMMVAIFCGATGLSWADAAGNANKVNPPVMPLGQKQKVIGSHTDNVKSNPKLNGPKNGKNSLNSKLNEEKGIYYYFKHTESSHKLVTGKTDKDGKLNIGGKVISKTNGPQNGKYTQKTVKKAGKETLVNYNEGDPDKPIVTGQAHNGSVTIGGR